MKQIAIVTATRAEYGLLLPVILKLRQYETNDFKVKLIVTGTHLCNDYGHTIDEIINDGVRIDYRIEVSVSSANASDISKNQADVLTKFASHFEYNKYDGIVLLGDRYETLAVAIAASNALIPIFHLCGGDATEGAIDEWIRHSITKMSYLHFVTNEDSRHRVMQLGEEPSRIYNFGSTSIDNVLKLASLSKKEALDSIGLSECKYALCTYHPVTMVNTDIESLIISLVKAIEKYPNIEFVITKSNADKGGRLINNLLDEYNCKIKNIHVFSSLGVRRYLSLMRYAEFVLGNSSSGIIETPAFKIPTVNIGDRQKGRLQAKSIINCGSKTEDIIQAIDLAMSDKYISFCKGVVSPYGDGTASERIAKEIWEIINKDSIDLKKSFVILG